LDTEPDIKEHLKAYILMKIVKGLQSENYIMRAGSSLVKDSLISEIGVFGILIGYMFLINLLFVVVVSFDFENQAFHFIFILIEANPEKYFIIKPVATFLEASSPKPKKAE
jgi:hypothetical protein